MANKTIGELTDAPFPLLDTDKTIVSRDGATLNDAPLSALPISTAQQTALDLKAPLASPTFTGTVAGITKAMVGLTNVDNTSDANKPISSATQSALNLKLPTNATTDALTEGTNNLYFTNARARAAVSSASKYRAVSTGFTFNTGVFGLSVNNSTNVEAFTATMNWKEVRRCGKILKDGKAGEIALVTFPLFYVRSQGDASATNRILYDKMLENPLYIEMTLETVYQRSETLITAYNVQGTVGGNPFYQYTPSTHSGNPWVDFEFILDRDVFAGQEIGVKIYIEDTGGALPCRLPQGKPITKSSTVNNFEYIRSATTNTVNTNARGRIQTETSFTQASSDVAAITAFGPFCLKLKHSGTVWGVDADSIGEGFYDEKTSDGTALVLGDTRGDANGNAGWFAVYTGTKLKEPTISVAKGSDQLQYHTPAYIAAMTVKPAAWPSGTIPVGNYLRVKLMDGAGVNKIAEGLGTNDIASSRGFTQILPDKLAKYNYYLANFAQAPAIYPTFLLPKGREADTAQVGKTSPLGQTLEAYNSRLLSGNNSARARLHRAYMSGNSGLPIAGYIDACQVCENDPINFDGLWKSLNKTFSYQFSQDIVHPNQLGSQLIGRGASMVSPSLYEKTLNGCAASEVALNLNSTANQQIYINPNIRAFKVKRIVVSAATTGTALIDMTSSAARVQIFADSGSTLPIAAAQAVAGLTDLTKAVELTLNGANASDVLTGDIYLKLSVAHGSAAYFNVNVYVDVLG